MPSVVRKLLSPRVFIPVVLAVGAVFLLFSFGNPQKILRLTLAFPRTYLLWFFLLMVVYEVLRFAQWWFLLRHEGVRVPLKAQLFSFAGGETTKFMPIGNYFQNYLLKAVEGTAFAFSSAVTTLVILLEVAVSLTGLVILPLDGWAWLRPLTLAGGAAAIVVGWLLYRFRGGLSVPRWIRQREWLRTAFEQYAVALRQFGAGARSMLRWRVLGIGYLLAAAYLAAAGAALYLVLLGLGVTNVSLGQALAVYCFSLALGLIIPIPVDLGIIELTGVGALLALGVERNAAITAMLLFRVLSLGSSVAIAAGTGAALHDQLRAALRPRGPGTSSAAQRSAPTHREHAGTARRQPSRQHERDTPPRPR
jgi:uncharacterized protein (TIRG00374 family)